MNPRRIFVKLADPTAIGAVVDAIYDLGQKSPIYRGRVDALLGQKYDLTFMAWPISHVELSCYTAAIAGIPGVKKCVVRMEANAAKA